MQVLHVRYILRANINEYSDVVIASYQLLKNPQYFHIGHTARTHIRSREERSRWSWVNAQLKVC